VGERHVRVVPERSTVAAASVLGISSSSRPGGCSTSARPTVSVGGVDDAEQRFGGVGGDGEHPYAGSRAVKFPVWVQGFGAHLVDGDAGLLTPRRVCPGRGTFIPAGRRALSQACQRPNRSLAGSRHIRQNGGPSFGSRASSVTSKPWRSYSARLPGVVASR
jgi:hypothetical protein